MKKCFITKLKGSSDNSELLKLGEMRIKIAKVGTPTYLTQGFAMAANKPVTLEIIGEGYFTDRNLTENKGKTLVLNDDNHEDIWVSNNDLEIAILDKYSIKSIDSRVSYGEAYGKNKFINIADLKYSSGLEFLSLYDIQISGDTADLKNLTALTYIQLSGTQISGDLADLKNLTALTSLDFSYTKISGYIADLRNLTALTSLALANTKISGNMADLRNLTALTFIQLSGTQISGDLGVLSGMVNLTDAHLQRSTFTGDLSKLPAIFNFVDFSDNKNTVLSWTYRPSTATVIAMQGNARITDVDKMLQDQAQCVAYTGDKEWVKIISCVGTRTSASDAAVQTLQSKGYTVSITPA